MQKYTQFINLRTDYGFKRVFGNPKYKKVLINFLNALLGDRITVTDVIYHDKEILGADSDGKRIIYDVYCTSQDGEHHFVLEMQNEYEQPFEDRVLFYTVKFISNQGERGWNYFLKPVISIVVTDFDLKGMEKAMIHEMAVADVKTGDVLTDKLRIFFLSLRQFGDRKWDECTSEIERYMYFIKNMEKMDKNSEAYKSGNYDDIFDASDTGQMANEEYVTYSNSLTRLRAVEAGREYMRREMLAEGRAEGMALGLEEGRAAGRAEGRAEGRIEALEFAAMNLMASGMSDEFIMKTLNLTESDMARLHAANN